MTTLKYIQTNDVNGFALLFRGNPSIHYLRSDKGKYRQVDEPATTEDYLRHLRGEYPSLLISPIMPGGKTFLVGADIDRHDPEHDTPVDAIALAQQITSLNLPLIVSRSKNGRGVWIWLFFKEADGYDAANAIRLMRFYLEVLGLDKDAKENLTEVFPKQTNVAEDKSGNGLNLPLFGDEREAYGPKGERLDIAGFLKFAAERAQYGLVLAHRDLDVTLLDHEVSGGQASTEIKASQVVALPGSVLRTLYLQCLDKLAHAVRGNWRLTVNATAFLAARIFAAHVLDASEADITDEIREVARGSQPSPQHNFESELDNLIDVAWKDGTSKPFKILDLEEEHRIAFEQIDQLLHDDSLEVTQFLSVMYSAAKLTRLEYDALRQRIAKRLKMSAESFDKHVDDVRPKSVPEKDELTGQAVIFEDIPLWPDEVDGERLLIDISAIFDKYLFFGKTTDADALAGWTLGTHAFDAFDIFPRAGVTSREENSGKSTVLKVLLRLVRSPFPGVCPTAAVLFRTIADYHCPSLIIDEGDNSFYSKENQDLLAVLNSGHEKDLAFVSRLVAVGDGFETRRFSTWSPMCYGMINRPHRTLLSRSIEIRMLRAKAHEVKEKLPRLRFTPPIFEELRRKCARWAADNVKKLSEVKIETTLVNRAGDNWEPLLQVGVLVGGTWQERMVTASTNYGDETVTKSDSHILLRDIRDIFHTRKVDSLSVSDLVTDLLLQIESPWVRYDHGKDLTASILGRLLSDDGIVSKPRKQKTLPGATERVSARVYDRSDFEDLFSRYLTGDPRIVPVSGAQPS